MNSLRQVLKSVDGKPITNLNQTDVRRAETIHILCVGPVDRSYMVHDVLLEVPNSQLSIVTDYRELWVIPKQGAIHLVILHNTLSLFELEEACRFIRQQWPHARILVVRRGGGFLGSGANMCERRNKASGGVKTTPRVLHSRLQGQFGS